MTVSVARIERIFRERGDLLPSPAVLDPPDLRAGLLRVSDRVQVVGAVHAPTLA